MLKDIYFNIVRGFARAATMKRADIPPFALGVETTESHAPIDKTYNVGYSSPRPEVQFTKDMQSVQWSGRGGQVNPADFPKTGYMGEY